MNERRIFRPSLEQYICYLDGEDRMTSVVRDAIEKAEHVDGEYDRILYIAGPLTGMSDEIKERYVKISDLASSMPGWFGYAPHLHGTDPVEHPSVSPDEVRDIDYLWAVVMADAHVNCLYPLAHGNGIEEGWAESARIPVIYLVPEEFTLSRLVCGMRNVVRTITYSDFDACLSKIHQCLAELSSAR